MQIKLELFEGKQKLASFSGQVPNGYRVFRIMSELLTTTLLNDITECISKDKDTSTSYEDDTPKAHQTLISNVVEDLKNGYSLSDKEAGFIENCLKQIIYTAVPDLCQEFQDLQICQGSQQQQEILKSEDIATKDIVEEVKEVKEVKEAKEVKEVGEVGEVREVGKEDEEVDPIITEKLVHTNSTLPKVELEAKAGTVSQEQEIKQKDTSSKVDTSKTIMLFMKCNKCHAIKCYKTQQGTTAHCSCGEEYPTDELVRISAICPNCGRSIGFMTAKGMDVSEGLICKGCGSPVDLEFNRKRNCWQSLNY